MIYNNIYLLYASAILIPVYYACNFSDTDVDQEDADVNDSNISGDDERKVSGSIAFEDFPFARAQAFCNQIADCCIEVDELYYINYHNDPFPFVFNTESCTESIGERYENHLSYTITPNVDYDPIAAFDCIYAYEDWLVDCKATNGDAIQEACDRVFSGKIPLGQACEGDLECEVPPIGRPKCMISHYDDFENEQSYETSSCGIDSRAPYGYTHGIENGPCQDFCSYNDYHETICGGNPDDPTPLCFQSDGLFCQEGKCRKLTTTGEACDFSEECEPEHHCYDGICKEYTAPYCYVSGICVPRDPLGAPCTGPETCLSNACNSKYGRCVRPMAVERYCSNPTLSDAHFTH